MVKKIVFVFCWTILCLSGCSDKTDLIPADEYDIYTDGTVIDYMTASRGAGVDIVFMGDGFSSREMMYGGKYEKSLQQAVEHFFSVEPYKSYREYFNVKFVVAISKESGITSPEWTYATKFSVRFTGKGSEMEVNENQVVKYAQKAVSDLDDLLVVLVANSNRYGGTTYMAKTGYTVAICPMSTQAEPLDFRGILQHEAGGHGFGLLADEYVQRDTLISDRAKQEYRELEPLGFYANVDTTRNLEQIKWSRFFDYSDRYPGVAAYEGAYLFKYGVWRPEETSCMILNIPYFNAPSREAIVRRIKRLAGEEFSFADFLANDVIENRPAVLSTGRSSEGGSVLPPGCTWDDRLPSPVIVDAPY